MTAFIEDVLTRIQDLLELTPPVRTVLTSSCPSSHCPSSSSSLTF